MDRSEIRLLDAGGLAARLDELARAIEAGRREDAPLRLVGIRSGGVPVAHRLAQRLAAALGVEVPVGTVDVTMYRDDFGQRANWPVLLGTEIPFPVDGAELVLVDDVFFTGRTARAALNAVCDLGRPACVRLAVLAERDGRELPLRADYAAMHVSAAPEERVLVRLKPDDPDDEVVRVESKPGEAAR